MAVQPQRLKLRSLYATATVAILCRWCYSQNYIVHCSFQAQVEVIVPPKRRPFQPHQEEVALSVFSGPATLSGNNLTFSGPGQVILAYTISHHVAGERCKDTLDVIVCVSAVHETGTVYSYTGGTAIANVVSNGLINGKSCHWGDGNATIAQSGSWPSGITLNTTISAVSVAPGTPAGTYQVPYQICDKLTPPNCLIVLDTVLSYLQYCIIKYYKTQTGGPNPVTAGTNCKLPDCGDQYR